MNYTKQNYSNPIAIRIHYSNLMAMRINYSNATVVRISNSIIVTMYDHSNSIVMRIN